MTNNSEFQTAIEQFQKEVSSILLELSASSDSFRESATFPLPVPNPPTRTQPKAPKKKQSPTTEQEKEETKHPVQTDFTQDQIDEIIIAASKRTGQSLESKGFVKNLKKKLTNVAREIIINRIKELKSKGLIVEPTKEQ